MAFLHSDAGIPSEHWHPAALAKLREQVTFRDWPGLSTDAWARSWGNDVLATRCAAHPELCRPLDRNETLAVCGHTDIDLDLRAYAVMAYGRANMGQAHRYNDLLAASMPNLLPLLEELPTLTREEAYERFRKLKKRRLLRGIGPSFFTKLMYFFGCPGAYILDQWLAKGVLALRALNWRVDEAGDIAFMVAEGNGIRLTADGKSITASVSGLDYEFFCRELDALAALLGLPDGAEAERWLFTGTAWLQYLKKLDWTSPGNREKARRAGGASPRIGRDIYA